MWWQILNIIEPKHFKQTLPESLRDEILEEDVSKAVSLTGVNVNSM